MAETLEGIPVWGCLPGSLAKEAGIRYGDIVLSVNGMPTANIDQYMDARRLRSDAASVVLFRDGQKLSIELRFEEQEPVTEDQVRSMATAVVAAKILPTKASEAKGEGEPGAS